jgi:hypothetical protein
VSSYWRDLDRVQQSLILISKINYKIILYNTYCHSLLQVLCEISVTAKKLTKHLTRAFLRLKASAETFCVASIQFYLGVVLLFVSFSRF